jgi:hypothetical protein
MKHILPLACLLAGLLIGCSKKEAAPEPLPLNQIATTLQTITAKGPAESTAAASKVAAALKANNTGEALEHLDTLSRLPALTSKQREVVSRCRVTLITELNAAAERGDEQAASTLSSRRATK